jgi:hypothetical protein
LGRLKIKKGSRAGRKGGQFMGFIRVLAAIGAALPRASKTGVIVGTFRKRLLPDGRCPIGPESFVREHIAGYACVRQESEIDEPVVDRRFRLIRDILAKAGVDDVELLISGKTPVAEEAPPELRDAPGEQGGISRI